MIVRHMLAPSTPMTGALHKLGMQLHYRYFLEGDHMHASSHTYWPVAGRLTSGCKTLGLWSSHTQYATSITRNEQRLPHRRLILQNGNNLIPCHWIEWTTF